MGLDWKWEGAGLGMFSNCMFSNCMFSNCMFSNCTFSNCTFSNCTFSNCMLVKFGRSISSLSCIVVGVWLVFLMLEWCHVTRGGGGGGGGGIVAHIP